MHEQTSIERIDSDLPGLEDRASTPRNPLRLCNFTIGVDYVVRALEGNPAWDRHTPRQEQYVHADMSDIWVRYNAWENYHGDLAAMSEPHESVWYPVANETPQLRLCVNDVLANLPPVELGMVLITKIPPGGKVEPHVDSGWHAGYYNDKYAVQLKGNSAQSFNFDGYSLSTQPGEVFWFDNSREHWVLNDSREDRMTMIVCTRRIH